MTENWKGLAEIWKRRDEPTRKLLILQTFGRHLECASKRAEPMQRWHCFTGQLEGSSWLLEGGLGQFENRLTLQLPPNCQCHRWTHRPACLACPCVLCPRQRPNWASACANEHCWASLALLSACPLPLSARLLPRGAAHGRSSQCHKGRAWAASEEHAHWSRHFIAPNAGQWHHMWKNAQIQHTQLAKQY